MANIVPTIGRKVWYFSTPCAAPQDATITSIDPGPPGHIGVTVQPFGHQAFHEIVRLLQPGEQNDIAPYATWMPYQMGQAAKNETLAKSPAAAEAAAGAGRSGRVPICPMCNRGLV